MHEATLAYLEYEQQKAEQGRDNALLPGFDLSGPDPEPPDQPEPLSTLRQMRRLNLPLFSGGLDDQPWIFLQEINAVMDAELDFQARLAVNLKLLERAQAQTQNSSPEA